MARESKISDLCPCGSGRKYSCCCEPLLSGNATASSPERLMRSRYTAFVKLNRDYLLKTWHPSTRPAELELEDNIKWLGLTVKNAGQSTENEGFVSFVARGRVNGRGFRQEENSRFVFENGQWFYVDGDVK